MRLISALLVAVVAVSPIGHANQNQTSLNSGAPRGEPDHSRIALVIGNSAYTDAPRLRNTANDARDMDSALRGIGFRVTLGVDVRTKSEMMKLIMDWTAKIPVDGIALFYFAGHGAQVEGVNFLFPVSARLPIAGQAKQDLRREAVALDDVLRAMTTPDSHVNILIIDACRTSARGMLVVPGLTPLGAISGPRGTYIAYATAPGSFAYDGAAGNGLFTEYLVKNLNRPDLKIEDLFKLVRYEVITDKSGLGQLPWDSSSLTEDVYLARPRGTVKPTTYLATTPASVRITLVPMYDLRGGDESAARIEGIVSGADPADTSVVLYSWTDKWYVQPTRADPFTEIAADGRWSATIHSGTRYAALLVRRTFSPPFVLFALPQPGGDVIALTTAVGRKR